MNKPKRALITGASGGIGSEFARCLAEQGCNLVLAARRTEHLLKLAEELKIRFGVGVEVVTVDLCSDNAPDLLIDMCTRQGKTVDFLINNAGAGPYRPFLVTDLNKHLDTVNLNIVSLTRISHLFARHMQAHGKPSWILNVASVASYQLIPNFSIYCSTKAFVRTFSEILSFELKDSNISVSCLCPGGTRTDFLQSNNQKLKNFGDKLLMAPEKVARQGIAGTLKGRRVIIPGILNKLMCWTVPLLPNGFNLWVANYSMSKAVDRID